MGDRPTKAFATRLQRTDARQLETAVEALGETESQVVRRVLLYYLDRNPDDVPALSPADSPQRFMTEMMEEL